MSDSMLSQNLNDFFTDIKPHMTLIDNSYSDLDKDELKILTNIATLQGYVNNYLKCTDIDIKKMKKILNGENNDGKISNSFEYLDTVRNLMEICINCGISYNESTKVANQMISAIVKVDENITDEQLVSVLVAIVFVNKDIGNKDYLKYKIGAQEGA